MSASAALIGNQAFQSIAGGISENNRYRAQAKVLNENARLTELQGEYDVLSALRKSRMDDGGMLADAAAAGGGGGAGASGSMADILYANAVERQMEALNIRASAAGQARGLRTQAAFAKSDGRNALYNGVMRAGAAVLNGTSKQNSSSQLANIAATERGYQPLGTIPVPRANYVGTGN